MLDTYAKCNLHISSSTSSFSSSAKSSDSTNEIYSFVCLRITLFRVQVQVDCFCKTAYIKSHQPDHLYSSILMHCQDVYHCFVKIHSNCHLFYQVYTCPDHLFSYIKFFFNLYLKILPGMYSPFRSLTTLIIMEESSILHQEKARTENN